MSIKIVCDQCGIEKRVNDRFAGRRVRCPQCDAVLRVPEAPSAPETPSVPEASSAPETPSVPEAASVSETPAIAEASAAAETSDDSVPAEAVVVAEAAPPSEATEDAWAAAVGSGEVIADPAGLAPPGSAVSASSDSSPLTPEPAESSEAPGAPATVVAQPVAASASPQEESPAVASLAAAVAAAVASPSAGAEDDEEDADEVLVRSKKPEEEMDMTPMVDVTFLLLIFFMVTAAFSLQKSIEMPRQQTEAPSVSNVEEEDETETVDIEVDENGSFLVLAPEWERETPGKQNLVAALREANAGKSEPMKLNVKVHEMAKVKAMVDAMDAGTIANYSPILITQVDGFD